MRKADSFDFSRPPFNYNTSIPHKILLQSIEQLISKASRLRRTTYLIVN